MLEVIASGVKVMMIATDGIYVDRVPDTLVNVVPNDGSAGLGDWEACPLSDLFIAKPGHYWTSDNKAKTRGMSYRSFEPFIRGWRRAKSGEDYCQCSQVEGRHVHVEKYADVFARDGWNASVSVTYNTFVGYRLALQRTDKTLFCQWISEKTFSSSRTTVYGDSPKRKWFQRREGDYAYLTEPLPGDPDIMSCMYRKMIGLDPFEVSALFEGPEYGRGFGDTEFEPLIKSLDSGDITERGRQ